MGNRGIASMAYGDGRIGQLLMQLGENLILSDDIDIDTLKAGPPCCTEALP